MLFLVWNKFEKRLPSELFYLRMVETGDILTKMKVFQIANDQCYQRFLIYFCNKDNSTENNCFIINDVLQSKQTKDIELYCRAIMVSYICSFLF